MQSLVEPLAASTAPENLRGMRMFRVLFLFSGGLLIFGGIRLAGWFWVFTQTYNFADQAATFRLSPFEVAIALAAVHLLVLGIGIVGCCQWARTLAEVTAWSVVVAVGLTAVSLLISSLWLGGREAPMFQAALAGMIVLWLALPAGLIGWLHHSRQVKALVASRHPEPKCADTCPSPLLAVALWLAFPALALLGSAVTMGFKAVAIQALPALVALWLATGWYRKSRTAWWLTTFLFILLAAAISILLASYPDITVFAITAYVLPIDVTFVMMWGDFLPHPATVISASIVFSVFGIGYLLWVRRYLWAKAATPVQEKVSKP